MSIFRFNFQNKLVFLSHLERHFLNDDDDDANYLFPTLGRFRFRCKMRIAVSSTPVRFTFVSDEGKK